MVHKNNYDIPAYKFGIVKYNNKYNRGKALDESKDFQLWANVAIENATIIPFENIDGLKASAVQGILKIDGPCSFVCYIEHNDQSSINHKSIIHRIDFPSSYLEKYASMTIDSIVENVYTNEYENLGEYQEVAKCFIQRYQTESFEEAKRKIYQAEKRNKY